MFFTKQNIPKIEKYSFHLARVRIIGSMEYGKTRNYFSAIMNQKLFKVKNDYAKQISEATGI